MIVLRFAKHFCSCYNEFMEENMKNEPMNDPLDAVFVSAEQVQGEQRALLARLLVPFAQKKGD